MYILNGGFLITTNFMSDCGYRIVSDLDNNFMRFPMINANLFFKSEKDVKILIKQLNKEKKSGSFLLKHLNDVLFVDEKSIRYITCCEQSQLIKYDNLVRTMLKNGVGLISYVHKRAVLHGNVILLKNSAYAIVAPSGRGKSTLTAALIRYCNAVLLSEDAVYLDTDGFTIYSGLQEIFLCYDSAINLYGDLGKQDENEKYSFSYSSNPSSKASYQLKGILLLENQDEHLEILSCTQIHKLKALTKLLSNLRYKNLLSNDHNINSLDILSRTLSSVPVYSVSLKKGFKYLYEQTLMLYNTILCDNE